ncbi:hypothetical protein E1H18_2809 [Caulobacter sp. RHG1]|nr:hypothetical protein [Caulobacter sp. RHG1]
MGRGTGTRRWIAGAGGVLVNASVLAGLALLERAPPVAEVPIMILALERPERERERRPSAARAGRSSVRPTAADEASTTISDEGVAEAATAAPAPLAVDPAWRVDPKAVERWRLTEGAPEWGWGRYRRACSGSTSEHLTEDEKERCYGEWGGRRDKRPSPRFVGPIDERRWQDHQPSPKQPSLYDKDAERQAHCRTYRRLRNSDPSMQPSLLQGGCF